MLLSLLLVAAIVPVSSAPSIGEAAPALDLTTLDGRSISRAVLLGRVTVVEFSATWCHACTPAAGDVAAVVAALPTGVSRWVVSVRDTPEQLRPWLTQLERRTKQPSPPVALDKSGETARAWGVARYPTVFVVDRLGIIRHINRGHGPGFRARLRAWVSGLLLSAN